MYALSLSTSIRFIDYLRRMNIIIYSERRQSRAQLGDLQDPDREQKFTNSLFANDGTI